MQIVSLRSELADISARQAAAEAAKSTAENEIVHMKEQIASRRADAEREARKRETLEREINVCLLGLLCLCLCPFVTLASMVDWCFCFCGGGCIYLIFLCRCVCLVLELSNVSISIMRLLSI